LLTDNRPNLSPQSCRIAAQPPPQPCIDSTPHLYPVSCRHAPTHQPFSWRVGCRSILGWCSATTTTTRRRAPLLRTWCKGRSPHFIKTRSMLAALPIARRWSRSPRSCREQPSVLAPRASSSRAPAQAIPIYRRALELAPNVMAARHNLGSALHTLKKFTESVAILEPLVRKCPSKKLSVKRHASRGLNSSWKRPACRGPTETQPPSPAGRG